MGMMNNDLLPEHYLNHFLVRACGIPDDKRTWTVSRKEFNNMIVSWTLGSDAIYVKSPGGNKDLSLSLETGNVNWNYEVSNNNCVGVSLIDEYVCMGYYVHHASDGRIIYDMRELLGEELIHFQYFIPFCNGLLCRVTGGINKIVYVDLRQGSVDDYPFDLQKFRVTDDQRYLLGWLGGEISCIDAESKAIVWSYIVRTDSDVEAIYTANFIVHGDKIYLHEKNEIVCLDVNDGAINWKIEISGQQAVANNSKEEPGVISLVCGNGVVVLSDSYSDNGFVEVVNSHNGEFIWRSDMVSPRLYIAGDILIVIYGPDLMYMQMRDLFTGEILWEMQKPLSGMMRVLAWGNRIVVSTTLGTFKCFEWSEPYYSPVRK
jgi:outer membrane protein assembly factor BamB